MYLEATDVEPGGQCRLVSPTLPKDGSVKCLRFSFNVYGKHPGALRVLDQDSNMLWQFIGHNINSSGKMSTF